MVQQGEKRFTGREIAHLYSASCNISHKSKVNKQINNLIHSILGGRGREALSVPLMLRINVI